MRRIKFWVYTTISILALFSVRDKDMVLRVPDGKPLVAEAYHSPASIMPELVPPVAPPSPPAVPFRVSSPAAASQAWTNSPDSSYNYSPDNNISSDEPYTPTNSSNAFVPAQSASGPQATASSGASLNQPAIASQPVYYGLGGVYPTTYNPTATPSASNAATNGSDTTVTAADKTTEDQKSVFITGLTPSSGIPGISVTIQGAGFGTTPSSNVIQFGTTQATSVSVVSANQLHVTVPQGIAAGFTDVTVSVNGSTSKPAPFDLLTDTSSDVFIDILRDCVDFGFNLAFVLNQIFEAQSLIGKAHIHHAGRVSFRRGQIDQSAFSQDINAASVFREAHSLITLGGLSPPESGKNS